jgi:hypothetical protein
VTLEKCYRLLAGCRNGGFETAICQRLFNESRSAGEEKRTSSDSQRKAAAGSEKIGDGSSRGHDTQPAAILPRCPK